MNMAAAAFAHFRKSRLMLVFAGMGVTGWCSLAATVLGLADTVH